MKDHSVPLRKWIFAWFQSLRRSWRSASLVTRLLVPAGGILISALILSSIAFIASTELTRNSIIHQQLNQDLSAADQILSQRADSIRTSAQLMASDPTIRSNVNDPLADALRALDARAVVMRDRFSLDLLQLYSLNGSARTNLLTSELFRVSSLFKSIPPNTTGLYPVDGRLLLISRASLDTGGDVINGIDLQNELRRMMSQYGIQAELGITYQGVDIWGSANPSVSPAASADWMEQTSTIHLGASDATLRVGRDAAEINRVSATGLYAMLGSLLLMCILLLILLARSIRSITHPVTQLADISETVALSHTAISDPVLLHSIVSLNRGGGDELSRLAGAFYQMLQELNDLYRDLEGKVDSRTRQLAAASEIARAASSTLETVKVLDLTVHMIADRFGFHFVGLFVLSDSGNRFLLAEAAGAGAAQLSGTDTPLLVDLDSPLGAAIQTRKPVFSHPPIRTQDRRLVPVIAGSKSQAVFPIIQGNQAIGALVIQSELPESFTADLNSLFETLTGQLSVAIHNAKLFSRAKETAERLAQSDQFKSRFMATISHELRTPLNAIIGFSKVLLKGIDGPLTEVQRTDIATINHAGNHLLDMINDILDLARLEAGNLELERTDLNPRDEILAAVIAYRKHRESNPVIVDAHVAPSLPGVSGDRSRFRRVIQVFLEAAAETSNTGRLTLTASHSSQWVMVAVADNGEGLAPEEIAAVFNPFKPPDSTNSRGINGFGLGLSIALRIVELHGGKLWVESKPGLGTVFSFLIPILKTGWQDGGTPSAGIITSTRGGAES